MTDLEPVPPDPWEQFVLRLIPHVGEALAELRQDLYQRDLYRVRMMAQAAGDAAGMTPEQLVEIIVTSERVTDLLRSAIDGARRTSIEDKVRALGRVLATGALAEDDAEVDEAELMMRTLDDIGAAEIRSLLAYAANSGRARAFNPRPSDRDRSIEAAVNASLQRHGLIEIEGRLPNLDWHMPSSRDDDKVTQVPKITPYGRRLLEHLADVEASP